MRAPAGVEWFLSVGRALQRSDGSPCRGGRPLRRNDKEVRHDVVDARSTHLKRERRASRMEARRLPVVDFLNRCLRFGHELEA
jgi:hypothetical protein